MDATSAVFLFCAIAAWTAAGYKVFALFREPSNAALWVLAVSIVLPATGFTVAAPVIYPHIGRASGIPDLATLVVYGCIAGYGIVVSIMLLLWHKPPREARRAGTALLAWYGTALGAMIVLFFHIDTATEHPLNFDETFGPTAAGGAFLLVYVSMYTTGLVATAVRGHQFARHVATTGSHPWLRRGLRIVSVGSCVALGYALCKSVFVVLAWSGVYLPDLSKLGVLFACLASPPLAVGLTMPSWGPKLTAGTAWLRKRRQYRQLRPLWDVMYRAIPGIALEQPTPGWGTLGDLDFRLYRRLVEIRDGRLALAPHMPDTVPDAEELAAAQHMPVDVVREALRIRTAADRVRTKELARPVPLGTGPAATAPDHGDDIAWLVQLAAALDRIPAPRAEANVPAADKG
ncbi:MAB_1171c family putative transporter [Krasilnikovia sp. MM14-A1259]|uniref:MAB_1171c family putative transporter n=1 Tax=Krasilnikovia sp. MM14-A1259 TaxID=3373539 RepID=UPI003823566F